MFEALILFVNSIGVRYSIRFGLREFIFTAQSTSPFRRWNIFNIISIKNVAAGCLVWQRKLSRCNLNSIQRLSQKARALFASNVVNEPRL